MKEILQSKNSSYLVPFIPIFLALCTWDRLLLAIAIILCFSGALLKKKKVQSVPLKVRVLAGINILAFIVSNLLNGTSVLSKPQSYYLGFIIYFGSVYFANLQTIKMKRLFIASSILVGPIGVIINDNTDRNIWKYCLGLPTILLILFLEKKLILRILLLSLCLVISVMVDARSLAFIALLGVLRLVQVGIKSSSQKNQKLQISQKGYWKSGFWLLFLFYAMLILSLFLGYSNITALIGFFLLGRPEFWINLFQILEKPLTGWGTSHIPSSSDLFAAFNLAENSGHSLKENVIYYWANPNNATLQSHSYIGDTWIKGGIFAALFWMLIILTAFRTIYFSFPSKNALLPIFSVALIWNILFSPQNALSGFEVLIFYFLIDLESPRLSSKF